MKNIKNLFEGLLVVLVALLFVLLVIGLPIAFIMAIWHRDGAAALVYLALNWIVFSSIYKSINSERRS
jgi:uncharacterized membrane protein YqjE